MVPATTRSFKLKNIFIQANAPSHSAEWLLLTLLNWFQRHQINASPDINTVENLLTTIKRDVYEERNQYSNKGGNKLCLSNMFILHIFY